jgi:DNA-binding MarR family transcriptional regulator
MGELLLKRLRMNKPIEIPALEAMLNVMLASVYFDEWNERILSPFGITRAQHNVLRILRGVYPAGHPRQEITRRLVDRSPDVTRLIDRLEAAGFVERERTDLDRRLSIARITVKGLALLEAIEPEFDRYLERISTILSREEFLELSRICEKLYSAEATAEDEHVLQPITEAVVGT